MKCRSTTEWKKKSMWTWSLNHLNITSLYFYAKWKFVDDKLSQVKMKATHTTHTLHTSTYNSGTFMFCLEDFQAYQLQTGHTVLNIHLKVSTRGTCLYEWELFNITLTTKLLCIKGQILPYSISQRIRVIMGTCWYKWELFVPLQHASVPMLHYHSMRQV